MVRIQLSRLMGERKLKQSDVVRGTGLSKNIVNDLYHEFAIGIKLEYIEKLCDFLECEVSDLITIEKRKSSR